MSFHASEKKILPADKVLNKKFRQLELKRQSPQHIMDLLKSSIRFKNRP